ncbi:serpin-ZX-like isoform X1 [Lotus japonicus]|uniref:serpin-ZX-like isoform X1 n=1 Tax=Lotus japonicus TaxID=34305 RepID=UPI002586DC77|nr:serpin-ZX-like isoform X1 [Lotus japonicus]
MWADKSVSLSHSFKQLVATHYKAALASADFRKGDHVCREVNSWVEKETKGLIKNLLPPGAVDKTTRLIFANALHFKGVWKHKFDVSITHEDDFHLLNGTSVKVPYMRSNENKQIRFISTFGGFKVLRLFYEQGRDDKRQISMYIFLPNEKDGLPALIDKLASQPGFLKHNLLLLDERKVQARRLKIPKFKISFEFEASQVLKELGVVLPFSQRAGFTKMVEVNSPSVGSIFHKASIEVNEEETVAVAATAARMVLGGVGLCPHIDYVADHPFLFLIREDITGTIVFVGQVLNPLDGAGTPVKEDLGKRKRFQGKRLKKMSSDFESKKTGKEKEEDESAGHEDDKPVVPPKRKRSSKVKDEEEDDLFLRKPGNDWRKLCLARFFS